MSSDNEQKQLAEMVMQSLEASGQLSTVKAMLRQVVFSAVNDEQPSSKGEKTNKYMLSSGGGAKKQESPLFLGNRQLQSALKTEEAKLALVLVKELLQYYEMDYTENIFSSESNISETPNRTALATQINVDKNAKQPLLVQLVKNALNNSTPGNNYPASSKNSKADPSTSKTTSSVVATGKDNNNSSNAKKQTSAAAAAAPAVKYSSTKFDNMKNESGLSNHNNNGEIEESMGFEELSDDEDEYQHKLASKKDTNNKNTKDQTKSQNNNKNHKNPLFSSMDDTIGASVSHGQDMSVDSMKLEEDYDYYEDII